MTRNFLPREPQLGKFPPTDDSVIEAEHVDVSIPRRVVGGRAGRIESNESILRPGLANVLADDSSDVCSSVDYYWRADVYMDASDEFFLCSINYALYDTADCSDPFASIVDIFPAVLTPNQWKRLEFDLLGTDFDSIGFHSVRPLLAKLADIGSDDACVLDNVYFEIVPAATPIPTVSPVGHGGKIAGKKSTRPLKRSKNGCNK